ncbi:MAG: hypothetical protein CVU01_01280 [Bacteroidetes bacterium HGW-Bacteroidetes-18]|nr:MAG: hypothetical protein CVU01_01280 [Bacteroidetes bacterium HGW-Bacteroidetes-18]
MQAIIKIIIGVIINHPIAYLRWLVFKKSKPFNDYLKEISLNFFVAMIIITILMVIIINFN